MLPHKTSIKSQEEKSLQIHDKTTVGIPEQPKPQWMETVIERYPEQVGELLKAIPMVLIGNPKKIEADLKIAIRTLTGFFVLMGVIVFLSAFLAYKGILGGDAVGFILGSAFGSIITFLYRYLIPEKTQ